MSANTLTGLTAVLSAVALAGGLALARRLRDGRLRPMTDSDSDSDSDGDSDCGTGERAALGVVGFDPDVPVTLLQFSSAFCAPCRVLRERCTDLVHHQDGVRHLEVDAEAHLDVIRALGVWRTPTLLVLDASGRIVRRATGLPSAEELRGAVTPLLATTASPR